MTAERGGGEESRWGMERKGLLRECKTRECEARRSNELLSCRYHMHRTLPAEKSTIS